MSDAPSSESSESSELSELSESLAEASTGALASCSSSSSESSLLAGACLARATFPSRTTRLKNNQRYVSAFRIKIMRTHSMVLKNFCQTTWLRVMLPLFSAFSNSFIEEVIFDIASAARRRERGPRRVMPSLWLSTKS